MEKQLEIFENEVQKLREDKSVSRCGINWLSCLWDGYRRF